MKEPVSVEELAKRTAQMKADYEDKIGKLECRLKAMEKSPALKWKADDIFDPRPAKWQKGSTNDKGWNGKRGYPRIVSVFTSRCTDGHSVKQIL